jgi:hemoglobin
MRRRRVAGVMVVVGLLAAGCASMRDDTMMAKKSLYDRLGGKQAITGVVDDFIANVAADSRINQRFAGTNIPRLKTMLVDQICEATGGPCKYTGKDMKTVHAGMRITEGEFNALVEDLVKSLDKFKVPGPEKNELLTALGGMKPQIVGQ